jgi:hypothetical protein
MAVLLNASASGRRLCRVGGQDTCLIGTVSLSVPPRRPEGQGTLGDRCPRCPHPLSCRSGRQQQKTWRPSPIVGQGGQMKDPVTKADRKRLPKRRGHILLNIETGGSRCVAGVGHCDNGRLAEIFLNAGNDAAAAVFNGQSRIPCGAFTASHMIQIESRDPQIVNAIAVVVVRRSWASEVATRTSG